jgi:hypothetical protein
MKHLARRALPDAEPSRPYTYWWHGNRLNQGDTGTCVAHGCVHLVENSPILPAGTLNPFDLYREIVLLDEWSENDSEAAGTENNMQFGTSVRAGMKALQARGLVSEYLWAWDAETAARWVWTKGPIVIGINWYEGFDEPDSDYLVEATGGIRGGHCVVMDGVNMTTRTLRFLNSWGPQYANKGVARMSFDTFQRVLEEDGECAMAVEREAT